MTADKAIHRWLNTFGLPFYPVSAVPGKADVPYGTYELTLGAWDTGQSSLVLNLWYRTESESEPNAKAMEIAGTVGLGGIVLPCDQGAVWVKRGSPFCQSIAVPGEKATKRRYINLTTEFFM